MKRNTKSRGDRYEKHVAKKMKWRGYVFVRVTGQSADYGRDIKARTFPFLRKVIVQCKHYSKPVGVQAVQEAIAAKEFFRASKAIVATNNTFTKNAKKLARKCGVELWERY